MGDTVTAVLFDVDGTLVDSNYLHAVTWWQAFDQAGYQVPMAGIHRAIGMGSDKLLAKLLPADRDRARDPEIKAAHGTLYATFWSRLQPLPGAVALLRTCRHRGLKVVLASSADEREFRALRAALGADDAIDAATYAGEAERSKPDPDLVQIALDKAAVPAGQAVFVGDSAWDMLACRQAGVLGIGFLSGGIGREELRSAGASAIYDGPADLLARFPPGWRAARAS
jgi:HAD superfamily hydrolase (TIGR01509 family)